MLEHHLHSPKGQAAEPGAILAIFIAQHSSSVLLMETLQSGLSNKGWASSFWGPNQGLNRKQTSLGLPSGPDVTETRFI